MGAAASAHERTGLRLPIPPAHRLVGDDLTPEYQIALSRIKTCLRLNFRSDLENHKRSEDRRAGKGMGGSAGYEVKRRTRIHRWQAFLHTRH